MLVRPKDFEDLSEEFVLQIAEHFFPYDNFQPGQDIAIAQAIIGIFKEGKKHIVIDAPTGVGKTAIAYTIHKVAEYFITNDDNKYAGDTWRTTISTPTKHLQTQYKNDFPEIVDLKGKLNYVCPLGARHYNTAACTRLVSTGECRPKAVCPYVKQRRHWCNDANLRLTNSAMAIEMCPMLCMTDRNFAPLHIIDECHKMPNDILDHTKMCFDRAEVAKYADKGLAGAGDALEAVENILEMMSSFRAGNIITVPEEFVQACSHLAKVCNIITGTLNDYLEEDALLPEADRMSEKKYAMLCECIQTFEELENITQICTSGTRDFIFYEKVEKQYDHNGNILWSLTLKPIFARDVSEHALFRKNDYFVHMSATICNAHNYAHDMGIKKDELKIITIDNPIDVEKRRVNYLPVGAMTKQRQNETIPEMVDAIIDLATVEHGNSNGLVHVSSYALAETLRDRIRQEDPDLEVIVGRRKDAVLDALEDFSKRGEQLIVISPSMKEGIDLKQELCRWQVIAKVPFGFLGDELIRYKSNNDKDWYTREVVLDIVQSSGRATRGVKDYSVTYILDSSFDMVLSRGKKFFPEWWLDSLRKYD